MAYAIDEPRAGTPLAGFLAVRTSYPHLGPFLALQTLVILVKSFRRALRRREYGLG